MEDVWPEHHLCVDAPRDRARGILVRGEAIGGPKPPQLYAVRAELQDTAWASARVSPETLAAPIPRDAGHAAFCPVASEFVAIIAAEPDHKPRSGVAISCFLGDTGFLDMPKRPKYRSMTSIGSERALRQGARATHWRSRR